MQTKKQTLIKTVLAVGYLGLAFSIAIPICKSNSKSTNAATATYIKGTLPSTIDLNDTKESVIRSYYQDANNKNGNDLLISLKNILKNGQNYYSFDSGNHQIWKLYEIADRDWEKSPASEISGYNATTNKITGYIYENEALKPHPYVRALYTNRDLGDKNPKTAWGHGHKKYKSRDDDDCIEREHIWPTSHGFDKEGNNYGARGDPMHLRAADGKVNGAHLNFHYGYVDKDKTLSFNGDTQKYTNGINKVKGNYVGKSITFSEYTGKVFEPQDDDKGDIARACFYMVARYNYLSGSDDHAIDVNNPNLALASEMSQLDEESGTATETNVYHLGIMQDLLQWNRDDPPDEFEIHRNNILYTNYTKNRNPFVDFPLWAEFIWGNQQSSKTNVNTDPLNKFKTIVNVTGVSISPSSLNLKVGQTATVNATVLPDNASDKTVTFSSNNVAVASVDNSGKVIANKAGSAIITVKTKDGNFSDTCNVTVTDDGATTPPVSGDFKTTHELPHKISPSELTSGDYFLASPSDSSGTSLKYLNSALLTSSTHTLTGADLNPNSTNTGYFKINKIGDGYTLSNEVDSLYLNYKTKSKDKTNFDVSTKPDTFADEFYWTVDTSCKKYRTDDPEMMMFVNKNVTDRAILFSKANSKYMFKAYDIDTNKAGGDYSGYYLYKYEYTYDLLIDKLKTMTCDDMSNTAFHNDLLAKYNRLTDQEKSAMTSEMITCNNGTSYSADYAYNYAMNRYAGGSSQLQFNNKKYKDMLPIIIGVISLTILISFIPLICVEYYKKKRR